jgi:hypothetical protein
MMKKSVMIATALLLSCGVLHAEKIYAKVNGEPLGETDIKPMLKMFQKGERLQDLSKDEQELVLDQSIERKLIIQDAKRQKIDQSPKFQEMMQAFKERLLVEFWMQKKLNEIEVGDTDIKTYFENHRGDFAKDAKWKDFKEQLKPKVKMEKFQLEVDQALSKMKKAAKIDFIDQIKLDYR